MIGLALDARLIDAGRQCPECGVRAHAARVTYRNTPCFVCPSCRAIWIDCVTRPTIDPFHHQPDPR